MVSNYLEVEGDCSLRYTFELGKLDHPVLVYVQGRGEFLEKYGDLSRELGMDSWGFLSWDHRGQGGSGGPPGHIVDFDVYVRDLVFMVQHFVGNRPYGILAHSMGGLVSLLALEKLVRFPPMSLILLSPLLAPFQRSSFWKLQGLWIWARCWLGGSLSPWAGGETWRSKPLKDNPFTKDLEALRKTLDCPFSSSPPTWGWIYAMWKATAVRLDSLKDPTPLNVLAAGEDTIVSLKATENWLQNQSQRPWTLKIYPERHELLKAPSPTRELLQTEIRNLLLG